ncbi:ABC transporter ATP-binding protein [Actinocatenispora rupis]|uniref:ABC transporter ATP-binding protein n=1 Tax=Actinocatenispora rupis TaxID=519421 RepID=UPI001EF1E849|nr:ABC transporter ATP-binding protein [Actinocatenispora rupis]
MDDAVRADGLTKRYGRTVALAGVDLTVPAGTVHGLLGPNGAGKTTLLRTLFGLSRPDAGTLTVLGEPVVAGRTPGGLAGFVDSPRFYPYLSGRRNLELLAAYDRRGHDDIDAVLERVGLAGRDADRVSAYSSGMRQRLGLAAALLRGPRLLVLDEPVNGLDPAGIRDIGALLRDLAADGGSVLLSSHHMAEAEALCDGVTILRAGRTVHAGRVEELRAAAPAAAHLLRTTDDAAARAMAERRGVDVTEQDDGLAVRAHRADLDAYVLALASDGIAVRALTETGSPLSQLFFALTEESA